MRGEDPALVTLGKHDSSEDYSESVEELDDQERVSSFLAQKIFLVNFAKISNSVMQKQT